MELRNRKQEKSRKRTKQTEELGACLKIQRTSIRGLGVDSKTKRTIIWGGGRQTNKRRDAVNWQKELVDRNEERRPSCRLCRTVCTLETCNTFQRWGNTSKPFMKENDPRELKMASAHAASPQGGGF